MILFLHLCGYKSVFEALWQFHIHNPGFNKQPLEEILPRLSLLFDIWVINLFEPSPILQFNKEERKSPMTHGWDIPHVDIPDSHLGTNVENFSERKTVTEYFLSSLRPSFKNWDWFDWLNFKNLQIWLHTLWNTSFFKFNTNHNEHQSEPAHDHVDFLSSVWNAHAEIDSFTSLHQESIQIPRIPVSHSETDMPTVGTESPTDPTQISLSSSCCFNCFYGPKIT